MGAICAAIPVDCPLIPIALTGDQSYDIRTVIAIPMRQWKWGSR